MNPPSRTPRLLAPEDPDPVVIVNPASDCPALLVCEHAGQAIPTRLGDLGLAAGEIDRHIGWDIGAEGVARAMAGKLDCTLVLQRYSRLVVDCNRPPEAPDSIPQISDRTTVDGNLGLDEPARAARHDEIFRPFQEAVAGYLDRTPEALAITIHSFTPRLRGRDRPWDIGFLFRKDTATSARLANHVCAARPELTIGMNQPYGIDDASDWFVPRHGEARGLPHSLIEIRNDHIATESGQNRWGEFLAEVLARWLEERQDDTDP